MHLKKDEQGLHGFWEISLKDLELRAGLDANLDGNITWKELQAGEERIAAHISSMLQFHTGQDACLVSTGSFSVNKRIGVVFAHIPLLLSCKSMQSDMSLDVSPVFIDDIQHHVFWSVSKQGMRWSGILNKDQGKVKLSIQEHNYLQSFSDFLGQGVWHIWTGLDHILFVIILLFSIERQVNNSNGRLHPRLHYTLVTITAFTLAHSVTLAMAVTGLLVPDASWIEPVIALSVMLAGLNYIYQFVSERLWLFAFVFGLVHGFGFASMLTGAGQESGSILLDLVAFNLGVEAGQLLLVALVVPMLIFFRNRTVYRDRLMQAGSWCVVMLASVWFVQRLAG